MYMHEVSNRIHINKHLSDVRFEVLAAVRIQVVVFTLKTEAVRSSTSLVSCHITTWCHIPEDYYLNFSDAFLVHSGLK